MKPFIAHFEVVEDNNCPLYRVGDCFRLTQRSFSPPENKEVCLILVREMTELLFVLLGEPADQSTDHKRRFSCSGCTGLIKFRLLPAETDGCSESGAEVILNVEQQALLGQIVECPLFRTVPPRHLRDMMEYFREERCRRGKILIRKGEPNLDLFVILSGRLSVDDGPVHITTLGPGEICGEMSYLVGNVAGATVSALEETVLVAIGGEYFNKIIEQSPSVQLFMAQLLAERLARANSARAHSFESCMQGRLKEMAPAELFQILHMHQKTGVLTLHFSGREAEVAFREGCIINARYGELENQQAIYAMWAEREGVYIFRTGLAPHQMKAAEIGDFMALLMEGVKRVDESRELQ